MKRRKQRPPPSWSLRFTDDELRTIVEHTRLIKWIRARAEAKA